MIILTNHNGRCVNNPCSRAGGMTTPYSLIVQTGTDSGVASPKPLVGHYQLKDGLWRVKARPNKGGLGAYSPRKILKFTTSETASGGFSATSETACTHVVLSIFNGIIW